MVITKDAIKTVSRKLGFNLTGMEQDWDIEFANPEKLDDFLNVYEQNDLSNNEKIALMALILASYNEYLNEELPINKNYWYRISQCLKSEYLLFESLRNYWTAEADISENNEFKISQLIKSIETH